jgi:hypothetical protein
MVLATTDVSLSRIAIDAQNVYWITDAAVMQMALAGGAALQLAEPHGAQTLAVDGASVYWTNVDGVLSKVAIGGGPTATVAEAPFGTVAIAVNDTSAFLVTNPLLSQGAVTEISPK